MAASRFQRATALVPLALLSTAVTASLAGVGPTSAVAESQPVSALPDGSTVPTDAIQAPASLSRPGVVAPGSKKGFDGAVASASASGIPDAAISAYQRAETVINAADKSCHLPWQLVAAIGRVESDHGRANGNTLDDEGLATPGIYGIPLDGSNNTTVIRDTDAGQYDDDAKWDRAVGPMQFIPSTWSVVGVDGDNDGQRNPQDIDDAALATAVYLCSGDDDLSADAGRRSAVYRYNHSQDYVDLVLSFMDAYMDGDFTSVPNGTSSSGYFVPSPDPVGSGSGAGPGKAPQPTNPPSTGGGGGSTSTTGGGGGGGGTTSGGGGTTSGGDTTPVPTTPPTGGGGGGGGGGGLPSVPDLPGTGGGGGGGGGGTGDVGGTVDDTITKAEAVAKCTAKGHGRRPVATPTTRFDKCVANLTGLSPTSPSALSDR